MATTEKIPVTMSDGSVVEFNKRQKLLKTSTIDTDAGTVFVRLDFANGEIRNCTIPASLILRAAAHGAEQKLGDATAGEADIADAILSVEEVIARLEAGDWNQPRAAGSNTGTSILIQALVEVSGKDVAEIKAFLENKTQADKLALRRTDQLRPVVERLEAEKASRSKNAVDTSALLGELGLGSTEAKKSKG